MPIADPAMWSVGVGLLTVGVSGYVGSVQVRRQWLLSAAALVTQLLDEFNRSDFAACRRQCAELARRHLNSETVTLIGNNGFGVLGMFEHISYMVRRRALDRGMVQNKFGWEMVGYYSSLTSGQSLIEALRINYAHRGVYEHYEWLVKRLIRDYRSDGVIVYDERNRLTWLAPFLERETNVGLRQGENTFTPNPPDHFAIADGIGLRQGQ